MLAIGANPFDKKSLTYYPLKNEPLIQKDYRIFDIPSNALVWFALILATDFVWYWYHRLGHEVNFFWAAHIVHHHSEEFNFTAAARITTFQAIIRTGFWCVLEKIYKVCP